MEKKGTLASPATALANNVLPVPGGPTSNTPLGMRAPTAVNFCGDLRNSTISCNSCFSSSAPATSVKRTLRLPCTLALLLPKFMACLFCPPILRNKKNAITAMSTMPIMGYSMFQILPELRSLNVMAIFSNAGNWASTAAILSASLPASANFF